MLAFSKIIIMNYHFVFLQNSIISNSFLAVVILIYYVTYQL